MVCSHGDGGGESSLSEIIYFYCGLKVQLCQAWLQGGGYDSALARPCCGGSLFHN